MIVVSNTSPIINLAAIGQLSLLSKVYGNIVIPEAVYTEITVAGAGQPGATEVQTCSWIERKQVQDISKVKLLSLQLDPGEADAIALAIELQADVVLLDEHKARGIASRLGLRPTGILGVLIAAKRQGHIILVKPALDELMLRAGFWVSEELYKEVLEAADE